MPMGASVTTRGYDAADAARLRTGGASGPELAVERGLRLGESAGVGTRREVLPTAVAHDETHIGPLPLLGGTSGDAERRVQDRAGRDADEHALVVQQLAHAPHCV